MGKSLKTIQRYLKEPEPEKTWTSAQVLKEREIRKAINALNKWKEMEPMQKREKELLEQLPDILTALSRVIDQDK
ncbi:MAG: hypothetical protein VKK04_22285 [Synechococcales bacterium]|nr:hypothetical protein [Synechococcales bacterium]